MAYIAAIIISSQTAVVQDETEGLPHDFNNKYAAYDAKPWLQLA